MSQNGTGGRIRRIPLHIRCDDRLGVFVHAVYFGDRWLSGNRAGEQL
jgi:hypothetical protein